MILSEREELQIRIHFFDDYPKDGYLCLEKFPDIFHLKRDIHNALYLSGEAKGKKKLREIKYLFANPDFQAHLYNFSIIHPLRIKKIIQRIDEILTQAENSISLGKKEKKRNNELTP